MLMAMFTLWPSADIENILINPIEVQWYPELVCADTPFTHS